MAIRLRFLKIYHKNILLILSMGIDITKTLVFMALSQNHSNFTNKS
jgi:hypothetical protein